MAAGESASNIKVAVRCRPLNAREIARGAKCLVRMQGNQTLLEPPQADKSGSERERKTFAFDHSYWSAGSKEDPDHASQQTLYEDLGKELLDHSFNGYNTCIFAYGQTGSGKSYSMMGYDEDKGIIPLICEALFKRIEEKAGDGITFNVEVSYIEIYQERVRDLLNPANKGNLRVREHPSLGPYVEGLSKLAVNTFADIDALMDEGMKARTVASTLMNETSSRSHAVFTIVLTQKRHDQETNMAGEKSSRISLVDLAGSERANSTGATGQRLKEGALINKSLTTLGRVIATLAAASSTTPSKTGKGAADKVPYRDSVLTWLLKDSLGGNSKTAMIATISPADYEETLSTLRYADQAKKIKNKAVVNEDPNATLIRELKEELATLRNRMSGATSESTYDLSVPAEKQLVSYRTKGGEIKQISKAQLQDQLEQSEKLMASLSETWEEKLAKTRQIQDQREKALEALGISIDKNEIGVSAPRRMPHLVNLNEDPLMSECLVYQIKPGKTTVGNVEATTECDIRLSGASILPEHCFFNNDGKTVTIYALSNATTMVNGIRLPDGQSRELRSGYRIILGDYHVFRFNHPEEARRQRERSSGVGDDLRTRVLTGLDSPHPGSSSPAPRPESPAPPSEHVDWSFARREALTARLNGSDVNLDALDDDELNRLFKSVSRLRHARNNSQSLASGSRPESRLSLMETLTEDSVDEDDVSAGVSSSRPSGVWSTNPTSHADSTMTVGADDVEERVMAVRNEYEERIQEMLQSSVVEVDEIRAQKEQMEAKLRLLEEQVDQSRRQALSVPMNRQSSSRSSRSAIQDSTPLTPLEAQLARKVIDRWRSQRTLQVAEDILTRASAIKEANVLAKDMRRAVSFQLAIRDRKRYTAAETAIEGLDTSIDGLTDSAPEELPAAGVRVLDRQRGLATVWSIPTFESRLNQMRNLLKFVDRPGYCEHLSMQDPFSASNDLEPSVSLVASGIFSLAGIARGISSTSTLQLYSPYMVDPIGSLRLRISFDAADMPVTLEPGSTIKFKLDADKVVGLPDSEFAALHLEVPHASLFGVRNGADSAVLRSDTVGLYGTPCKDARLSGQITQELDATAIEHLRSNYGQVDVYARPKSAHFDRIERWDEARDALTNARQVNLDPVRGDPELADVRRRHESEFVADQRHDVVAKVELCELTDTGDYAPVPVTRHNALDRGAFALRPGIQRRIVLKLAHNSGRAWRWRKVTKATLGNIRLQDSNGYLNSPVSSTPVQLRSTTKSRAGFASDGTAVLSFEGAWDSSMHDCLLLNRVTASGQRVIIELEFDIQADHLDSPISFRFDLALNIQKRDAGKSSRLFGLLRSEKTFSHVTALFAVRLRPKVTRNAADIWRLDTSEVYVRGEEKLDNWKPRGLSLVRDYFSTEASRRKAADVEAARGIIESANDAHASSARSDEETLGRALALWQSPLGRSQQISFDRSKTASDSASILTATPSPSPLKVIGTSTLISQTDLAAKKGYMAVLRDPTRDAWRKYWAVLRRPYLHLYDSNAEYEECMVVNLATVRVEQSPEIEAMLERQYSFAIFTQQNSYFIQAQTQKDMIQWIKAIDPSLA